MIIFMFMLLSILWLSQIVFLNNFYKFIKIKEMKNIANEIVNNFENKEDFNNLLQSISKSKEIDIEIFSQKEELMFFARGSRNIISATTHDKGRFMIDRAKKLELSEYQFSFVLDEHNMLSENVYIVEGGIVTVDVDDISTEKVIINNPNNMINGIKINVLPKEIINSNLDKTINASTTAEQPIFMQKRIPNNEGIVNIKFFNDSNGNENALLITSMVTPVEATVGTLKVQLYYITAIMILFSISISLILSKRVANPIEKINIAAKSLAKGNYNVNFHSREGYKEISELSSTLNFATIELSKVESLRKELIANVSHDLRTPLTLISGFAEVMRDLPNENTTENASIIVEETNRLTRLVNDLLDLSKLQEGVRNFDMMKYNLSKSLLSIVNTFRELLKKDNFEVNFYCEEDFYVISDEIKINQVFYNLLSNAINYTGDSKLVDVIIKRNEGDILVEVIDYGEGIKNEDMPYIWDRYYKIDKVHKQSIVGSGSGIGLSIVKSILEMCPSATYGVTSKLGDGTTFYFSLKEAILDEN